MKQLVQTETGKSMQFVGGVATFISRPREVNLILGGGTRRLANDGSVVQEPVREAIFKNRQYTTRDPENVRTIVLMENFCQPLGYLIDAHSIPEAIRDFYVIADVETKRQIALALAEGLTPEDVVAAMSEEELAEAKKAQKLITPTSAIARCPYPGCDAAITGGVDEAEAKQLMARHLQVTHPDFGKQKAEAKVVTGQRTAGA